MTIKFCGAAREVTGSCHLLTLDNGFTILLDCGLYQGRSALLKDFNENWLFDPAAINCMVLSHAHIDHSGRIPKLVKDGFSGTIYSTHATRELANIMLLDSAGIQERDAQFDNKKAVKQGKKPLAEPLYTDEDVRAAVKLFASYNYEHWFHIHENVQVRFTDAGHILGSASVTLKITEGEKTTLLGFTADIGRPNRPILNDPQPMPECDILLCESTYGDRLHEEAPEETARFLKIVEKTCVEKRGKLIIPAFSVGRTQEIVYILDKLVEAKKLPPIPVYVDSPLAVDATQVFINHPECFDGDLHEYMLKDPNPFGFQNLTFIRDTEGSKKLNASDEPCIIISSSGMANAGRVKHHLANNIENWRTTVLIVGYASPDSPAGILRSGGKLLRLFGEVKKVNCEIEIMDSFSAHGDYKEMLQFIDNQKDKLKKLFLVHGDFDTQITFKKFLNENGFPRIEIPELGEEVELTEERFKTTPQYFVLKGDDSKDNQVEQGE
ncbi:MAG: MBL fold metallo-hydrolase [Saprospiraceae bacterium]|nr:MBL fold metallo-hydrolase [Saprospiraceae bacterium]